MLLPWAEHPKCLQRSDHGCFTGLSPIAHVADRELLLCDTLYYHSCQWHGIMVPYAYGGTASWT